MDIHIGRYLTLDDEGMLTLRVATTLEDGTEGDADFIRIGHVTQVRPWIMNELAGADLADDLEAAEAAWGDVLAECNCPYDAGPAVFVSRRAVAV